MADTKTSALPDAGTLTGAEIVPVVQSGGNRKLSLTALLTWITSALSTALRLVPTGGTTGQVLRVDGVGVPAFETVGLVPAGSVVGYVLRQTGSGPYDHGWEAVRELPEPDPGGLDDGKFVQYDGGGSWVYALPPEGLPAYTEPADNGKVVTLTAGVPVWAAPVDQSAGSAGQIQAKASGGGFAGASKAEIAASGSLKALEDADTAAAPADSVILRGQHLAGMAFPGAMDEEGAAAALQWSLSQRRVAAMLPPGGSNAPTLIGMLGWTLAGNPGGNIVTFSGSLYSSLREYALASAATAGATCGYRHGLVTYGRGTAARMGGFLVSFVFGVSDAAAVADARMFVGMIGSAAAIGNVNPSTLTNIIGVGCDNGGTQLVILHNDSSGTATSIATSASFPANTRSTDLYRITFFAPPNASWVGYTLENITSGAVQSGRITTDLPAGTVTLAPQAWRNNGATALAVRLSLGAFYSETLF